MKHSDFVCPDCLGSKELYDTSPVGFPKIEPCPCDHKTAIEKIDLDVPDGFTFDKIVNNEYSQYARFSNPDGYHKWQSDTIEHKIGDTWVCEVCGGSGIKIPRPFECRDKCPIHIFDCKDCGFGRCPNCKGLKAECVDIQVEVETNNHNKDKKHRLIITWREV